MARPGNKVGIVIDLEVHGTDRMRAMLAAMPQELKNGVMRPVLQTVLTKGVQLARQELVRVLPKRNPATSRWQTPTGALRNSLGQRVFPASRMRNKNLIIGFYGARTDFRVTKATARKVSQIRRHGLGSRPFGPLAVGKLPRQRWGFMSSPETRRVPRTIQPHKYIGFVERGHKRGKGPVEARPYPFLGPSQQRLEGMLKGIVRSRFNELYPQQVARLKRKYLRQVSRGSGYSTAGR